MKSGIKSKTWKWYCWRITYHSFLQSPTITGKFLGTNLNIWKRINLEILGRTLGQPKTMPSPHNSIQCLFNEKPSTSLIILGLVQICKHSSQSVIQGLKAFGIFNNLFKASETSWLSLARFSSFLPWPGFLKGGEGSIVQQGQCLPALKGVHMSLARDIISIFHWYKQRRGRRRYEPCAKCSNTHTITWFSVTSRVILNEFCHLIFVLTMFINRLKSLI